MKKKQSKETLLKKELAQTKGLLAVALGEKNDALTKLQAIKEAVLPSRTSYSVSTTELVQEIMGLVYFRKYFEGRIVPELEHIKSLERILRWTINPESAKDDEATTRFEEERKRNGY